MAEESAALDFWEITNLRRVELGKKWKDVLAETELSHETLNRWRKGLKVDPLTDRAFERALQWAPGARIAATAGREPEPLDGITVAGPPQGAPATPSVRPTLEQELEVARRVIAATAIELGLSPDEAAEAFRRAREDIVRRSRPAEEVEPEGNSPYRRGAG